MHEKQSATFHTRAWLKLRMSRISFAAKLAHLSFNGISFSSPSLAKSNVPRALQIIGLLMRNTLYDSCRIAKLYDSVIWHLPELNCLNLRAQVGFK